MKKTWLMGSAAAAALVAVSGAAQAADVMPIVVPVVTPAVVPVPGPVKVVQIDTSLTKFLGGPFVLETIGAVDVRTASGWGFQFLTANSYIQGTDGYFTLGGRVYRAMGDATVGVFANAAFEYVGGLTYEGLGVGVDLDYYTDAVELYASVTAFFDGGFQSLQSVVYANIERGNFVIDVAAVAVSGPLSMSGGVQVGYRLGPVTPYAILVGSVGGAPASFGVGAGLEFEHQVGERLTLTAEAMVLRTFGGLPGLQWQAEAGVEYTLGAAGGDGPLSIRGSVMTGTGGGIAAQIGIGLKFGGGRVTGAGGLLMSDNLPGWFL
ncbi:MAG: hypothetical protein IT534_01025 [Bauldia sp.]|nr:hypothetical protein [Bauldia sp.]